MHHGRGGADDGEPQKLSGDLAQPGIAQHDDPPSLPDIGLGMKDWRSSDPIVRLIA
jgi:hypothetical protein